MKRYSLSGTGLLLVFALVCCIGLLQASVAKADNIYVKEGVVGNGTSWADATGDLRGTVDAATAGDIIWVAAGTYTPAPAGQPGTRTDTFQLSTSVELYGGFPYTGSPTWEQRDWLINKTVLSGNILDPGTETDNCYHVLYATANSNNAILDGFIITEGFASGTRMTTLEVTSSASIRSNSQIDPIAKLTYPVATAAPIAYKTDGGGMLTLQGAKPKIRNCIFVDNYAWNRGGGMCNLWSSPTIINCTFIDNQATGYPDEVSGGGGMYNYVADPEVINSRFLENLGNGGGGMYNYCKSNPIVDNCLFENNIASPYYGGGMENRYLSSPIVTRCIFNNNYSPKYGGGMENVDQCDPIIDSCSFTNNRAGRKGGGMVVFDYSDPQITNCIFYNNAAVEDGGGIYNETASPIVVNCTIYGNSAGPSTGGGFYNKAGTPTVTNCIFWGDTSGTSPMVNDEIYIEHGTITLTYSDVQGGYPGIGNISGTPLFVNPDIGDLHLQPISPCLDVGSNMAILQAGTLAATRAGTPVPSVATDIDGNDRIMDGNRDGTVIVDMGADEFCVFCVKPLDLGPYGNDDGSSWADSFDDLQQAINAAETRCHVWVASGTYVPSTTYGGTSPRYQSFQMKNEVEIYGGFPNTGSPAWTDRDWQTLDTVLSGEIGNPGTKADNCYHVVYNPGSIDATAILDGVTVTNGYAMHYGGYEWNGGGMLNYKSSPTIANCTFTGNFGRNGSALVNFYSSPAVTNCAFIDNSASYGAGMYGHESSPIVTNCTFTGNTATGDGGGFYNYYNSCPTLTNCTFSNNTGDYGGGMYNAEAAAILTNCTFSNNTGATGGGMHNYGSFSSPTTRGTSWEYAVNYDCDEIGASGNPVVLSNDTTWTVTITEPADIDEVTCYATQTEIDGDAARRYPYRGDRLPNMDIPLTLHGPTEYRSMDHSDMMSEEIPLYTDVMGGLNMDITRGYSNAARPWNLSVGATWTYKTRMNLPTFLFHETMNWNAEVVAIEDVTVPLGTFSCYKVEANGTGGASPDATNTYWWAVTETFQCPVKYTENYLFLGAETFELSQYVPSAGLWNCTFFGNHATSNGGGMYNDSSSPDITNSIFWSDTSGTSAMVNDEIFGGAGSVTYSDIQGSYTGIGNINQNPLFINSGNGDFHLQDGSPCIDSGINTLIQLTGVTEDFEGDPRIYSNKVDMGVDETMYWSAWAYDTDQDGVISKAEALQAVVDFFAGLITKEQALDVIVLFFS